MIWTPTLPATLPDTPPTPGTPINNPAKNPWDGVMMGASSGNSDKSFNYWPPGSKAGLVGQHHQKGKVNTGSGQGGPYGYAPMVNASAGSTKSGVGEQTDEEFNQAWKDQGLGWKLATPGLIVAASAALLAVTIGVVAAAGSAWAVGIVGRSLVVGVGAAIWTRISSAGAWLSQVGSSVWGGLCRLPASIWNGLSRAGQWINNWGTQRILNALRRSGIKDIKKPGYGRLDFGRTHYPYDIHIHKAFRNVHPETGVVRTGYSNRKPDIREVRGFWDLIHFLFGEINRG